MRLRDFLYLNRSDRRVLGFVAALAVAALAILYVSGGGSDMTAAGGDSIRTDSYQRQYHSGSKDYPGRHDKGGYYAVEAKRHELFPFDPNTADSTALLSLGLQPWQVRNIYRYRAAGGVYSQPEDLARLYGLSKKKFEELRPYIRIGSAFRPSAEFYEPRPHHVSNPDSIAWHHTDKIRPGERVDLNTADTNLLKRVPGIGSYFARRVESYRNRLGGFFTEDQLLEIEYFPKEALQYFSVEGGPTRKLNINKLPLADLKRHPYINYYQAKAIVDFRRLRGPIKDIAQLRLIKDFSEKDIERLRHYVEY